jgi:hypothetical protein
MCWFLITFVKAKKKYLKLDGSEEAICLENKRGDGGYTR